MLFASERRMLVEEERIPMIGSRLLVSMAAYSLLIIAFLLATTGSSNGIDDHHSNDGNSNAVSKHPVFFSEYKLRSSVEAFNSELRQLKRDFVEDISNIYLSMKSDSVVGFERAKKGEPGAVVLCLMAEQFADLVIKRHIIQRRLLTGLKMAFVKFLPMETIKKLIEKFESYSWLKSQNQVDLRPKFPGAKENQYVQLYSLIELRARVRASDDVQTLTSDNIRRILKTVQLFLIEQKTDLPVSEEELKSISWHAQKILNYYLDNVVGIQRKQPEAYRRQLEQAAGLTEMFGGQAKFERLIDEIINAEVLDIDLNREATNLDLPPTISAALIDNIERKWIPKRVLQSLADDRELLMSQERIVKPLAYLEPELNVFDVAAWLEGAGDYISKRYSHH